MHCTLFASPGGGYQYRLCAADQPLTEACFQKMPLAFVPGGAKLRFAKAKLRVPPSTGAIGLKCALSSLCQLDVQKLNNRVSVRPATS